jgi:hypothetical protein
MPFEDVHDLELIADVTEENHITLESDAPDVGAQFRSHPSHDSGQGGKLVAAVGCRTNPWATARLPPARRYSSEYRRGRPKPKQERPPSYAPTPLRRSSALHRARAASSRSSVTGPPAAIEASSVARSALSFASRSSTRRRPSRTTSLAELQSERAMALEQDRYWIYIVLYGYFRPNSNVSSFLVRPGCAWRRDRMCFSLQESGHRFYCPPVFCLLFTGGPAV